MRKFGDDRWFVHRETHQKVWEIFGHYTADDPHLGWTLKKDPASSMFYWVNTRTKQSAWTDWIAAFDKQKQQSFYFNIKTKQSLWSMPQIKPPAEGGASATGTAVGGKPHHAKARASAVRRATAHLDNGFPAAAGRGAGIDPATDDADASPPPKLPGDSKPDLIAAREADDAVKEVTNNEAEEFKALMGYGIVQAAAEASKRMKERCEGGGIDQDKLGFPFYDAPEKVVFDKHPGFKLVDFAPQAFLRLRLHWGVKEAEYKKSLALLKGGGLGEGKSKMLFFKTADKRYIIKTVKSLELDYFLKILENYYYHMLANRDTLLCKFCGLYRFTVERSGKEHIIVVMQNALANNKSSGLRIRRVYDLKGSTKNRMVDEAKFLAGRTGKDRNWQRTMAVGAPMKRAVMRQLHIDVAFLRANNIMDYSLILGVAGPRDGLKEGEVRDVLDEGGMTRSKFQSYCGGVRSSETPEVFYFAIIDILQPYDWKKTMETRYKKKSGVSDLSKAAISSVPANEYGVRFLRYVESWMK
jgi:hypothetical protein